MAISRIHISCDLWRWTNFLSLLGVVAHFLKSNNLKRTILLEVQRMCSGHDGDNVRASLLRGTGEIWHSGQLGSLRDGQRI